MPRKVSWNLIRDAVEAGMPYKEAAKRYQVGTGSIRARASKEKWATPQRVGRLLYESSEASSELGVVEKSSPTPELSATNLQQDDVSGDPTTKCETQQSNTYISDPRVGYEQMVAYQVAKKVQRALPGLQDPRTWRDVNTADAMVRRALGLDKQTVKAAGMFSVGDVQGAIAIQVETQGDVSSHENEAENMGWFDGQE